MCCESNEAGTIESKLKRLVDLVVYLVDDAQVIDVDLMDREFEFVCLSKSDSAMGCVETHTMQMKKHIQI